MYAGYGSPATASSTPDAVKVLEVHVVEFEYINDLLYSSLYIWGVVVLDHYCYFWFGCFIGVWIENFYWLDYPSNVGLLQPRINSRKIALIAVLVATAIATNYLMIGALNVKFMDLIVFTSGYLMGSGLGAFTGALVWLIYGTVNPFGFSLPVFASTIIGETMFGIAGGFFANRGHDDVLGIDPWVAVTGFLLTFLYDLFTNIVSGLTAGVPIPLALITGTPFMLAHTVSNAVFFGFGFKPLVNSINKVMVR